eukprot:scaffold5517_cov135-Cylindrotheca_fusiformis.AAC.47
MSKWLSSVNNLLEKLDDTAEAVAEERRAVEGMDPAINDAGFDIDDIVAKRGLSMDQTDTEGEPKQVEVDTKEELDDLVLVGNIESKETKNVSQSSEGHAEGDSVERFDQSTSQNITGSLESFNKTDDQEANFKNMSPNDNFSPRKSEKKDPEPEVPRETKSEEKDSEPEAPPTPKRAMTEKMATPPNTAPPLPSPVRSIKTQKEKELILEAKEAQKESRTLRRHVVSLNSQLEAAESELQAQRKELEYAAHQMEKDRLRTKEAKESAKKSHNQELLALKAQHEEAMKEQQRRFEDQLQAYRNQLAEIESQRKQEDGNWSKEMTSIIDREQEMSKRDEKVTLLSQISTLHGQQAALGSRLESLTQAADNAMERERDAEDRLDSALTQHARQISHRQARESELERTIQELNAALVSKSRQKNRPQSDTKLDKQSESSNEKALIARVETLQSDLETAVAHLTLEREKVRFFFAGRIPSTSAALHQELREMSKETTLEASTVHAKQLHYERKVADLELKISKLERDKSRSESTGVNPIEAHMGGSDQEMAKQVKVLSEEIMRLREKISNQNSELLALKNRLQTAVNRALKAEEELALASAEGNDGTYDSMEKAKGPPGLGRRRKGGTTATGSIRSAMQLNLGQGERTEQIGKVIDVVDSFAVTTGKARKLASNVSNCLSQQCCSRHTGKYLRRNPLARAGFVFYLVLMHLWTFVLLFLHAHSFETDHADFAALAHGPHAVLQKSKDISQQGQVLSSP